MHELLTRFLEEARGTWRFRWQGLMVAWVIAVAGGILVCWLPDQYTSSAQVHVDTQSLLRPLLHGLAVEPNLNTEVALMANTLLSHQNLEKIAQNTGMISPSQSPERQQSVLDRLRENIVFRRRGNDLYTIGYTNVSPARAEGVVRVVLNTLMETTLGNSQQDSKTARSFLQTQVAHYADRLQAEEARLAKFQRDHLGMVPNEGGTDYFQRLNNAEQHLSDLRGQLFTAQSEVQALDSEIATMKNGKNQGGLPNAQVQSIDAQIQVDRKQLNNLLLTYTSRYPGVVTLKQNIKRLEAERAKAAKSGPGNTSSVALSANPVYQKLEVTRNQTEVSVDTLKRQIAQQRSTVSRLKGKAGEFTSVQAKLADLTRNYNVTKQQYEKLLARLDSAQISGDVQHSGAQVKFQVIDPPQLPLEPSKPRRVLLLALVLAGSLLGGGVFAFFLRQIRPVFMNRSALALFTGYTVLGSVSMAVSRQQLRKARARTLGFVCVLGLLVIVLGVSMIFAQPGAEMVRSLARGIAL